MKFQSSRQSQTRPNSAHAGALEGPQKKSVSDALQGAGRPLADDVRKPLEDRFGHDFSQVRIHADARAADSARTLRADAFTVGQHIAFRAGKYAPYTSAGRELLAHELTHSVQQRSAPTLEANAAPYGDFVGTEAAEFEADQTARRVTAGRAAHVSVASPVGIALKDENPADRSYWFQSRPPEKPTTVSGIEITPKGQVFLDPHITTLKSDELGTFQIQFAGLDTDFQSGKPTAEFAAAENKVIEAIAGVHVKGTKEVKGVLDDLGSLPEIKNAPSMKAALAQRKEDETVRARLKEAPRTLVDKKLNVFIATELSVAEKMSQAPLSLRTEQIFVRPGDIGDPAKLEAAIRVPLIALTGGNKGIAAGPGGKMRSVDVNAMTREQLKEGVLHELVHVMLINRGASAVQLWKSSGGSLVSGPDEVKRLADDVLFRYVRAQEEIFVYKAIAGLYSEFAGNKEHYELYELAVEAFLASVGAKSEAGKPTILPVKDMIGETKSKVDWSITYKLPKAVKVDQSNLEDLKTLQKMDIGS
jgi:hypothetical protein